MKFFKAAVIIITIGTIALSCKTTQKQEMSIEDYAKIDMEIVSGPMTPEAITLVAKKYGYTYEQYQQFSERVQKEPALQEKLGDIRLSEQKKKSKK